LLDPSLSDEAWPTVPLPTVVLEVQTDRHGKSIVTLAPLTRRRTGESTVEVLLTADEESRESDTAIVLGSGWVQDPHWCYYFIRPNTFLCDTDRVRLPCPTKHI
jgi:hypothetical protein